MKKIFSLVLVLLSVLPCFAGCQRNKTSLYNESYIDLFDTVCTFYGAFETAEQFSAVSILVKEELTRLDALFDGYQNKSDQGVYAVNSAAGITPVKVDPDLFTLIELALDFEEITNGALSPTMGALTALWKKATEEETPPDPTLLKEAGTHIDASVLELNTLAGTVYLTDPQASIDLGAFAKGYAADRIAELLRVQKCENYLLDLGGNIYAKGNDPKTGLPFSVGVAHPNNAEMTLPSTYISGGALVTSGNDQRGFIYQGKNYHHIISSETLYPAESGLSSVSVLQGSAVLADALSTALFILGEEEGKKLLDVVGGEALFVSETGKYTETDGFSAKKKDPRDNVVFILLLLLLAAAIGLYLYRNAPKKKKDEDASSEKPKKVRFFTKKDIIFLIGSAVILIACFLVIVFSGFFETEVPEAVVRQNGEVVCRLSLSEDRIYQVGEKEHYNVIAVENGEVYIYASDCKNGCCMKSGRINSMSLPSVLVCLPHRLTVSIEEKR